MFQLPGLTRCYWHQSVESGQQCFCPLQLFHGLYFGPVCFFLYNHERGTYVKPVEQSDCTVRELSHHFAMVDLPSCLIQIKIQSAIFTWILSPQNDFRCWSCCFLCCLLKDIFILIQRNRFDSAMQNCPLGYICPTSELVWWSHTFQYVKKAEIE